MTWIKIDDSLPDHPKLIGLTDLAFRVHIKALCHSGRYLTDGFISYATYRSWITLEQEPANELTGNGLWDKVESGYQIHDYLEYQSSRNKVDEQKKANRERVAKYKEKKRLRDNNALLTYPDTDTDTDTPTPTPKYQEQEEATTSFGSELEIALPRVNSAKLAVTRISDKLSSARANGINAWNLSRLVEDEWDVLHTANDIGGCIALTIWYVSELQSRKLESPEIARIGQMTKRFGRIALLAIDEAASKDLTDLVSYAFRIAQNKYKEKVGS